MTDNDSKKEEADRKVNSQRKLAIIRTRDPFYRALTAGALCTWQEYGTLVDGEAMYKQAIEQGPSAEGAHLAYHEIIKKQLLEGGGNKGLQDMAHKLILTSLPYVQVDYLMGLMGSKEPVSKEYAGKYLNELAEEEAQTIAGTYLSSIADNAAAMALAARQSQRMGNLENLFCKEETPVSTPVAPKTPKAKPKKRRRLSRPGGK